ncbi:MAG UNVERIFIED_CONTAM: type II toxin-antitoxin system VapC family toxin [Planctomycetaceae bacterium]|jgi:tRNA(fMet)-specific endonuclease VapC
MSFLVDTNICSAQLKFPGAVAHRMLQYSGRIFVSSIVLGELLTWAYRRSDPAPLLRQIKQELLADITVLDYDHSCAERFGHFRGSLLQRGISVSPVDLMIASVALTHDLVLVTHNTHDFSSIPDLHLDDWLSS